MEDNIIQLHPKASVDYEGIRELMEYLYDMLDLKKDICEFIYCTVEETVKRLGLSKVEFVPDPETYSFYMEMPDDGTVMPGISYNGAGTDNTYYRIDTFYSLNDDQAAISVKVLRFCQNKIYYYSNEENRWILTDAIGLFQMDNNLTRKQAAILLKQNLKSKFLEFCLNAFGNITDKEFDLLCQKNQKLIQAASKIEDIVNFDLIPKNGKWKEEYKIGGSDFWIALIPEDPFRSGMAVIYEDNLYKICQYMDDDETPYLYPVESTEKPTKVSRAFELMANRYSGNEDIFSFPLSFEAFVETRTFDRTKIHTMFKHRTLTENEKKNQKMLIQEIQNVFFL